ncbi:hypothetical protein GYMLUDRAFT_45055 [Collybiopsis luxurians FD-317 M1]|uniref:Uncharacterized protein n=1 Tax=Collybiopsis luxurians FD-317 M1 TaxID=944289 RepID=A0A0D0C8A9_9AGAR|nr:hypothetical protein GYMLUDRAFT_45055 [Collybiopsis luxurians FD-317 M1]
MNRRNVGICGAMQVLWRYVTHRYICPPEIAQESRTKSIQQHLSFHGGLWICFSRAIECLPGLMVLYSKVTFAIMCTAFYKGMHNSLNMRAQVPSKEAINF